MKDKIIAVDFDGTLCENIWPEIGAPNHEVIKYLTEHKRNGAKIILWTCRVGDALTKAVDWCGRYSLYFDAINANLPHMIEYFGSDCRKVFANEYIDDKSNTVFKLPFKVKPVNNLQRVVWEGWTPQTFIDALSDEIAMIMSGESWRKPFNTKEEMVAYIVDNQPYYKKPIPEVNEYFVKLYSLEVNYI